MSKKIHSQDLASNIESWILNRLRTRSEVFNGLPPCPYAKAAWSANEEVQPVEEKTQGSLDEVTKKTLVGLSGVASLLIMLVVL